MLRKSLLVLTWAILVSLAAIVVFAVRFSGPAQALAEAESLIAHKEFPRAVNLLDFIEMDVTADREDHDRLLRLRMGANSDVGNHERALRDAEELLRRNPGDIPLRLEQIRLLAKNLDGEAARVAVQRFLTDHPGHGRALELAGEVCQTLYQPALKSVMERLDRELSATVRPRARSLAWSFLYRPAMDPEIASAFAGLAALHAGEPRLQTVWLALAPSLQALRAKVQEGLGYFRQSLEAPGEPVAAFRNFALSLDLSRRVDDLLAACEIHRRRFDHRYVDEAGAAACWALLRDGHADAALATAERWLAPGTVAQRLADRQLGAGTLDLMTARAWAAYLCSNDGATSRAWDDVALLDPRTSPPLAVIPFTAALTQLHWKDWKNGEKSLEYAGSLLARDTVPIDRLDLVPRVAESWLGLLRNRGAGESELQACLRWWRTQRPATLAPLLAEANLLQERGRTGPSLAPLEEARKLAPDDAAVFARYLAAQRALATDTGQDGPTLLLQCLNRQTARPEVQHPIGYLLCGEAALAQNMLWHARNCALAAREEFPMARAARLLQIRISVAESRFAEASRQTDDLLDLLPPDAETVELALAVKAAAKADCRRVLALALTTDVASAEVQQAVLAEALATSPPTAIAFVTPFARSPEAPIALQLLAARALATAAMPETALTLVDRALAAGKLTGARQAEFARAFAAWIEASAVATADADLLPLVQKRLSLAGDLDSPSGAVLTKVARTLAACHPATALLLASTSLAWLDAEDRHGEDLALLGRLALRAGRWQKAEDWWTAALAFPDGLADGENLVRLCLAQGRPERAQQVRSLLDGTKDPALALRFEAKELAGQLAAAELKRDGADLLAWCVVDLLHRTGLIDWPKVEGAEATNRAELLALLREPALAPLARERTDALLAQDPHSRTHRLLAARVHAQLGEGAKASAIHQELDAEGADGPVLFREIALAAKAPGYVCPLPLRTKIMGAATNRGIAGSPVTLAFATEILETGFREAGHPELADQVRLSSWQVPQEGRTMTAADLEFLATKLPPAEAWSLIDEALVAQKGRERGPSIDRLQTLAAAVASTSPAEAERVYAEARRLLASDGARGSLVHFLLDHAQQVVEPVPAEQRLRLCQQHLERVAAGLEHDRFLPATVQRLLDGQGLDATEAQLQELMWHHPTSLPLWLVHTRLLTGTSRAAHAIADVRTVLRHADAPAMQLEVLVFAAEAGISLPDDRATLQALPTSLRDGPLGKYLAAMLALRQGRADEALPELATAPPRRDGMHLFALALAALQSSEADGPQRAKAAFEQLVRDYPSSSLARNAGSFANQLAER